METLFFSIGDMIEWKQTHYDKKPTKIIGIIVELDMGAEYIGVQWLNGSNPTNVNKYSTDVINRHIFKRVS